MLTKTKKGARGFETEAWANAAGMKDFLTFTGRCRVVLNERDFVWPEGVTSISYGPGYVINKPGS